MLITKKTLKTGHPSKLCLVIPLGNGAKVQYPVESRAQAIALYQDYIQQNSSLDLSCNEPLPLVGSAFALQTP
ncbi:MAG: hypothetical protein VKK04_13960 [Synechococcales bacterium]|nr:hypothetical protein [Synechococcales bacterium]